MTSARVRRTHAERTAATRQALLDAAFDAMVELGYRGTTTTEVAHRAGVSLGALVHHFPTKVDLVVGAAWHAFDRRQQEYLQAMGGLDPAADKLDGSIDLLWSMMSSPAFTVCMELVVAARTDPDLAVAFVEADTRFMAACQQLYADMWVTADGSPDPAYPPVGFHLVWALLEGLAMSRLINGYQWHPVEEVLDTLKAMIQLGVATLRQAQMAPQQE